MIKKLRSNRSGWTLVELLIGLLILGIILGIMAPKYFNLAARGKFARVAADLRVLASVAHSDFTDDEEFSPDTLPGEMPAAMAPNLEAWPAPPCPGWSYDWENTVDVNFTGFARFTVRNAEAKALFYRCVQIYGITGACEDPGDFVYGGEDIGNKKTGQITCAET